MAAATDERTAPTAAADGFVRREAPWFLSLLAVSALAIAQPILSLLATDPTIFEGLAPSKAAIVAFGVLVTFGPAVALWGIELVASLINRDARRAFHAVFLAMLATAFFIRLLKRVGLGAPTLVLIGAIACGIGLSVAYTRYDAVRRWLNFMSPIAPVLLVVFLFFSPAQSFLTAGEISPVAAEDLDAEGPLDPVVVVVVDELGTSELLDGSGNIDADLFPNLAALGDDATWYRNTTTVGPHTPLALSGILSGQYPSDDLSEAVVAPNYDGNLFSLLTETHHLNVFEPVTRFCAPSAGCTAYPQADAAEQLGALFDLTDVLYRRVVDPATDTVSLPLNIAVRDEGDPNTYFDRFLASLDEQGEENVDRPRLDFVHVMLPHAPYRFLPSGSRYEGSVVPLGGQGWEGPWDDEESAWGVRQRHLLQAQYADHLLGELLDELHARDRYDESLVVVTADHGSAFVANEPSRGMTEANASAIAWVPLLVKSPGQTGAEVSDAPLENIDILPTIAEVLGVSIPWKTDGVVAGERSDEVAHVVPWELNELQPEGDGPFIELDRGAGFDAMLATAPFGLPGDAPRWRAYRRGPYGDLLGVAVEDATVGNEVGGDLESPRDEVRLDADAAVVPAYVYGTVDAERGTEVAVAVNGVVAAVLPVHDGTTRRYWGLVPEHVLRPGTNHFDVYVVDGPPDEPVLHPLT